MWLLSCSNDVMLCVYGELLDPYDQLALQLACCVPSDELLPHLPSCVKWLEHGGWGVETRWLVEQWRSRRFPPVGSFTHREEDVSKVMLFEAAKVCPPWWEFRLDHPWWDETIPFIHLHLVENLPRQACMAERVTWWKGLPPMDATLSFPHTTELVLSSEVCSNVRAKWFPRLTTLWVQGSYSYFQAVLFFWPEWTQVTKVVVSGFLHPDETLPLHTAPNIVEWKIVRCNPHVMRQFHHQAEVVESLYLDVVEWIVEPYTYPHLHTLIIRSDVLVCPLRRRYFPALKTLQWYCPSLEVACERIPEEFDDVVEVFLPVERKVKGRSFRVSVTT